MTSESRIAFVFWLLLLITATAVIANSMRHDSALPIQTNMLALLPDAAHDPVVAKATAQINDTFTRQHIILIGSESTDAAIAAAQPLIATLQDSGAFAAVHARIDSRQGDALGRFYAPYRNRLLSPTLQQAFIRDGTSALTDHAMETLFSPASAINSSMLASDPLLLFYDFMLSLGSQHMTLHVEQGYPFIPYQQRHYLLVRAELAGSPFALATQQQSLPVLDRAFATARSQAADVEILDTGVLRFAAAGVQSAQREVSTIGVGSLIGIVLLFLWVFRSLTPLLLTLLPIASGFVVALATCLGLFGEVHLMTLVFGASLIGLSVDYSLHFLIDRQASDEHWQARDSLRRMGRGLWLGLASSVTAFLALSLTPFPGMQQMAVFCSSGLIAAALTVTGAFPLLLRRGRPGSTPGLPLARRWLGLWQGNGRRLWVVLVLIALFAIPGLLRLHSNDDIRLLQDKSPMLLAMDTRIREITGQTGGGQFLLVEGDTAEQVLKRTEQLASTLVGQQARAHLAGFDAISHWLPSRARQQTAADILAGLPQDPAVQGYATQIGLAPALLDGYAEATPILEPADWLADPASQSWRMLWLDHGYGYASIVPLRGIADAAAIADAISSNVGVRWVDPADTVSRLLKTYRERASTVVAAAFGIIALLLMLRYRPHRAITAIAPASVAAISALATVGWLGEPVTVFHLLALLLVLGFGLDYSLFLLENREHPAAAMLAIGCSAFTTVLSFGLLALSSTPAIHAFGIIVLTGIAMTLVLAPLAQPAHSEAML